MKLIVGDYYKSNLTNVREKFKGEVVQIIEIRDRVVYKYINNKRKANYNRLIPDFRNSFTEMKAYNNPLYKVLNG